MRNRAKTQRGRRPRHMWGGGVVLCFLVRVANFRGLVVGFAHLVTSLAYIPNIVCIIEGEYFSSTLLIGTHGFNAIISDACKNRRVELDKFSTS